jgi:DNA-binding XRE family transcriptional regulator
MAQQIPPALPGNQPSPGGVSPAISESAQSNLGRLKLLHLLKLAKTLVFTPYIKATCHHLEQSGFTQQIASQIADVALRRYSIQICAQTDGLESVSLNFSGSIITFGPEPGNVQFRAAADRQQIVQTIQDWVLEVFKQNTLWSKVGAEVWASLLLWTVQDLDLQTGVSVIESLAKTSFQASVWQQCCHPDPTEPNSAYEITTDYWTLQLATQMAQKLGLEQFFSNELEQFLGLAQATCSVIPAIALPETGVLPWMALQGSVTAAALPPDALPNDGMADSSEPDSSPTGLSPISLDHYLTRPQDLTALPWELLTQLRQNYGLAVVQLQFLLTAHAMRQKHPSYSPFTIKVSDIQAQLDWSSNEPELAPDPLELAQQIAGMKINTIWMTDPRSTQVEAFQLSGSPWELLTDLQGNLDWTTGLLSESEQTYLTVRPGLWTARLLELGGPVIEQAFHEFGSLALTLLQRDYCKDPFLLSLLTYLMLREGLIREAGQRPADSVGGLLTIALSSTVELTQTLPPETAQKLVEHWHQTLTALADLGWTPAPTSSQSPPALSTPFTFYEQCPSWLQDSGPRPADWIEQWLALSVQIYPPEAALNSTLERPLNGLSISVEGGKQGTRLRFDRLTGAEVRSARKALHLTQSQLADTLHVHQSLIAKIEAGQRPISDDLEEPLRQALAL